MVTRLHVPVMKTLLAELAAGALRRPARSCRGALFSLPASTAAAPSCARRCADFETRHVVTIKHGRGAIVRPTCDWDPLDRLVIEALAENPRPARRSSTRTSRTPARSRRSSRCTTCAAARPPPRRRSRGIVAATDLRGDVAGAVEVGSHASCERGARRTATRCVRRRPRRSPRPSPPPRRCGALTAPRLRRGADPPAARRRARRSPAPRSGLDGC